MAPGAMVKFAARTKRAVVAPIAGQIGNASRKAQSKLAPKELLECCRESYGRGAGSHLILYPLAGNDWGAEVGAKDERAAVAETLNVRKLCKQPET